MTGYCSNSPLRCHSACLMQIVSADDNCCPECGLSLVPANSLSSSSYKEQQLLSGLLAIIALLLVVTCYIYYANFV